MSLTVTKMHVADHGELDARLSEDGTTIRVTRRFGSWGTIPGDDGRWRELLAYQAAYLEKCAREQHFINRQFELVRA